MTLSAVIIPQFATKIWSTEKMNINNYLVISGVHAVARSKNIFGINN
jgi:hypothetical protein